MQNDLKIYLEDDFNIIQKKKQKINTFIENNEYDIYNEELKILKRVTEKLSPFLDKEDFSGSNAVLIYVFRHENRSNEETYISPEIYLTPQNTIVYEVYKPLEYSRKSPDTKFFKGERNVIFCEVPVYNILKYISLENILNFFSNTINEDYKDYTELLKRQDYLQKLLLEEEIENKLDEAGPSFYSTHPKPPNK